MTGQIERISHLPLVLRSHRDEIVGAWADMAPAMPGAHPAGPPPEESIAVIKRALDAIAESASTGSYIALETFLNDILVVDVSTGYDISVVIESLLLIKRAVVPFIAAGPGLASHAAHRSIAQLDDCLQYLIGGFGRLYAEMQYRLQEQQQRTAQVLHAVKMANSSLDLEVVLVRVAQALAEAVGVPYCGIYLQHTERGVLVTKEAVGDNGYFHQEIRPNPLSDLVPSAVLRELLEGERTMIIGDPRTNLQDAQREFERLGLTLVLVLPIKAGDRVLGFAVLGTSQSDPGFTSEEIDLSLGIGNAVALAINNVRLYENTSRQLRESQSLQRVTAALLQKLELTAVLEIVCSAADRLTGAQQSAVFLLEEDDWLRVAYMTGVSKPLRERVPVDGSFGGRAVRQRKTVLAYDPAGHISLPVTSIPFTALLAAPLFVNGSVIGALEATNKPGGFTEEDARVITLFADQAAIAIENVRLRQQEEHLVVFAERQRLSRELHDSVTQALYSVTLFADAAARLLAAGNSAAAVNHVQQLQRIAHDALREMRLLIFELRPLDLETQGLVAALKARLAAVENRVGLQVELQVEGEQRLPIPIEDVLYRVAQEALNNVLKHANARHTTVRLQRRGAIASLEVADDGVGFDLAAASTGGGLGLGGMRERVLRIGGTLEVKSTLGQGTYVHVEVPVT